MFNPLAAFDRLDTRMNYWLVAHSVALLRISLGTVFLVFGVLKFFPGLSPIQDLVVQTTTALTFGLVAPEAGLFLVAALETAIGLSLLTGRLLRVGAWLMLVQLLGAMSPLLLFPEQLFTGPGYAPSLAAQYIIKDIILLAAALVIASTWTGARIVPERTSMRSTLGARPPQIDGAPARRIHRQRKIGFMSSIEVADTTAAVLREQAARAGVSVDAYIRRLALIESARQHATVLDEGFYEAAEAERLTAQNL